MISRPTSAAFLTTAVVLLANTSGAEARRCSYDRYGRYRCTNGLARAARIGLGVGMAVLGLLIIGCLLCVLKMRRRRALKHHGGLPPPATASGPMHHEKPLEHQQPYPGGTAEYPNHNGGVHGANGPQFPEPAYQNGGGYAPPAGAPPQNYAPPAGPPPGK